jgi:hypothetical protein
MAPNWFVRLLGGFLPWVTKPFGEWLGKMLFYVTICSLVLMAYNRIFPTKPMTAIERIETQIVNQCPEENKYVGMRVNIWKLKLGVGI